jgi:phage baseplate assembly protein gpV
MSKSFALAALLIAACAKPAEKPAAPAPTPQKPVVQQQSAPASLIALTTPAGERVIEVAPSGSDLTVTYAGGVMHGRFKGEKRKYEALEVKFGDEGGFKVRTLDGKLLWKVKVTPDKIKVSDNEENKHPYELKIKDAKVKVYAPGDRLLGEVRVRGDHVDVGGKYRAAGTSAAAFYGVELLDGVPARERAVIFAELAMKR